MAEQKQTIENEHLIERLQFKTVQKFTSHSSNAQCKSLCVVTLLHGRHWQLHSVQGSIAY